MKHNSSTALERSATSNRGGGHKPVLRRLAVPSSRGVDRGAGVRGERGREAGGEGEGSGERRGGKRGERGREVGREGEGRGEREGEGSKERGGGKRGERGREAGRKGEGSGEWIPPCPPPLIFCSGSQHLVSCSVPVVNLLQRPHR